MTTITTWSTPGYRENCVELLIEALREYESYHPGKVRLYVNLDQSIIPSNRPVVFAKLNQILRALDAWPSDWVVWTDADAMVVNYNFDIDHWLSTRAPHVNCINGHDWAGLCGGFMCLRNNQWSRDFLKAVLFFGVPASPYNCGLNEQETITIFRNLSANNWHHFELAPSSVFSDTSIRTDPVQFIHHVGACGTRAAQLAIKAGKLIGGSLHGVRY
jgi:hypothetical protein